MVERDEYMREGFDPHSLTMPQLRGILVEHEVHFSSAARKADLVQHFNQEVLPKTASLRKKNASIVASSSGIIDMRDHQTPDQTPAKRKPGRPRKSEVATPSASAASKTPAKTPSGIRTPARKKSSVPSQLAASTESEAETDAQQAKSEPEEVEVPVKRKPGRPRKTAPVVIAAPVEASEPEDNASKRHVSFDANTSPPAPISRRAGRLSYSGARSDDDGTFSDSNPFQSGSEASPAPGVAAKAAASARKARRKTTDGSSTLRNKTSASSLAPDSPSKQVQKSSPSVGTTLRNYMDQAVAKTTPPRIISRLTGTTSADSTGGHAADDEATTRHAQHTSADSGAEAADGDDDDDDSDLDTFTSPSALAKMRILRRKRDKQRRREQRSGKSFTDYLLSSMFAFVAVTVLAYTVWYARETRALGFCDTGSDTNPIVEDRRLTALAYAQANNETLDDVMLLPSRLQASCTPCPAHADCAYGKVLGCSSDDWVLQPNLRSHVPLSSVVLPLSMTAPRCYPDTQKLVLASELAQAISHMLAEFKGEIVCGTQKTHATVRSLPKKLVAAEGNLTYAIAEGAVKRSMSATRDARVDEEYFEQIWYMALFELTDPRSNVVRVPISNGTVGEGSGEGTQYFLAAKQASLSLSCRSRLALKGWVLRARLYVLLALALASGLLYLRHRLAAARAETATVAQLVQVALEKLQEQEYLHGRDPVLHPDDFVPLSHLRDHVLRDVHHARTRNRLWQRVAHVVEENSNVRTRQAQKRGEWLRVWQWIGVEGWRGYEEGEGKGTPREGRVVA
ncbi:related to SRC1-involved in sister chromatid segregation [Sporisorium reilianum f. sp. reilianum]|uniref:Related to SRC1-involved in sister chromatid segregation n=1 Tax=Sporisorium reilianum f. sp. reilianum TaxID=72559 RepID=A0A2N8U6C2_9BASI|nr:related to SRC1-involved in sister chromatid segregation [Sporisorium reilianum f. sp. reilianum]